MSTREKRTVVFNRKKLQLISELSSQISAEVSAYEYDDPYKLRIEALLLNKELTTVSLQLDREGISKGIKEWLAGISVDFPSLILPKRVEESIMRYIKFGTIPNQEDFIMWILSRSEIVQGKSLRLIFGGRADQGARESNDMGEKKMSKNPFPKNVEASSYSKPSFGYSSVSHDSYDDTEIHGSLTDRKRGNKNVIPNGFDHGYDTYRFTKELLGTSIALNELKKNNTTKVKGRKDAADVVSSIDWGSEHYGLATGIETSR